MYAVGCSALRKANANNSLTDNKKISRAVEIK